PTIHRHSCTRLPSTTPTRMGRAAFVDGHHKTNRSGQFVTQSPYWAGLRWPTVRRLSMSKPVSIATVLLLSLEVGPSLAESEPVSGVRLQAERSEMAQSCSTESELAARLAARAVRDGQRGKDSPVVIHVQFDRDATEYVARLRVSGRNEGFRSLR